MLAVEDNNSENNCSWNLNQIPFHCSDIWSLNKFFEKCIKFIPFHSSIHVDDFHFNLMIQQQAKQKLIKKPYVEDFRKIHYRYCLKNTSLINFIIWSDLDNAIRIIK